MRQGDALFFTGPQGELFRERLTLFASDNMGDRWESVQVIDAGPTSYSSLAPMADASLGLLYERSDARRLIFKPDAIPFVCIATNPLLHQSPANRSFATTRGVAPARRFEQEQDNGN